MPDTGSEKIRKGETFMFWIDNFAHWADDGQPPGGGGGNDDDDGGGSGDGGNDE